jgi:hypothetical protein
VPNLRPDAAGPLVHFSTHILFFPSLRRRHLSGVAALNRCPSSHPRTHAPSSCPPFHRSARRERGC